METQRTRHETTRENHGAESQQTNHTNGIDPASADSEAWKSAAANRKYKIHDGKVWSGAAGMIFSLPPLPGFASLPESVQPLVFQSVAQFATNRVGQTAEGDVQKAIEDCIASGAMPGANTNDAFERHYLSTVGDRVLAARPLPEKCSAEQKAEHEKIVAATAIKNREAKFMEFVNAGIAASRSKPVTEKKRRAKGEPDTSAALDI